MSWKSEVWSVLKQCFSFLVSIFWAILVRLIFIFHTYLTILRVVTTTGEEHYWFLLSFVILQLSELIYRVAVSNANEGRWVCPCFFFYLLSTIPSIWILELDRIARYDALKAINATSQESLSSVQGISIPLALSADIWVSVIEQSLLFLLILCRWILPRGEITRDQLSQLLFVYIGMASDIMELFVLFDEDTVRNDKVLVYVILVVWTISLLQFCLVLTATRNPKKARVATVHPEAAQVANTMKKKDVLVMCLSTEVWSLMVTFLMQDGPFLCVRMFTLIRYNLVTYNILFFTCKNILVVLLLGYRLIVLCGRKGDQDKEEAVDDDEDDDDTDIIRRESKTPIDNDSNKDLRKYKMSKPNHSNGNFVSVLNSPGRDGKF